MPDAQLTNDGLQRRISDLERSLAAEQRLLNGALHLLREAGIQVGSEDLVAAAAEAQAEAMTPDSAPTCEEYRTAHRLLVRELADLKRSFWAQPLWIMILTGPLAAFSFHQLRLVVEFWEERALALAEGNPGESPNAQAEPRREDSR